MSEITPIEGQEEGVAVKPTVGQRLRVAREARGMSAADLAQTLKLSTRQVDALESDDWSKLPGYTIIRGFVRNYARVVGLAADELLADLEVPVPEPRRLDLPQTTSAVLPESGRVQKRDYVPALAGLVFVALALAAYFVVPEDLWQRLAREELPPVRAEAVAPANNTALFPPGGVAGAVPAPQDSATAQPLPVQPVVQPVVQATGAQQDSPVAPVVEPPQGKGVVMSFNQPSWVEIRDRSGNIIFSQLNPAGSQREVDGQPPFALVVGNAAHVAVRYKGRNIDLQPRSKDDVARVTVE